MQSEGEDMNTPLQQPGTSAEQSIVRSIDVGYGNVKFTLRHPSLMKAIECDIFPSLSPVSSGKGLGAGIFKARDTVVVNVGGTEYEVGKQVALAQGTNDESVILDKQFCLSDAYLARLRGALFYMRGRDSSGIQYTGSEHIELLVVGLPVNTFHDAAMRKKLHARLVGKHDLPDGRSVHVNLAIILPQPLGAFFEYAYKCGKIDSMKNQTNLIIDPGFHTFDWLLCNGLTPAEPRSGAVYRGVSAVLQIMVEDINKQEGFNTNPTTLSGMLNDYYRSGTPFLPFNKEIDVEKYQVRGMTVVNEAVSAMVNKVGDGADIQNIILAGGGAKMYQAAIADKFPHHKIIVMDEPVYSNVRGFQMMGEQQILKMRVLERKVSRTVT
jgi:plasmid segregation protein ParM